MNATDAVIDYLKSTAAVTDLVGDSVFGVELPRDAMNDMPQKTIVVHGQPADSAGSRSRAPWAANTVRMLCYGENPYEAVRLHNTCYKTMLAMGRHLFEDKLLIAATAGAGTGASRERSTEWPLAVTDYLVKFTYDREV